MNKRRAFVVSFFILLFLGIVRILHGIEDNAEAAVVSFIVIGGTGDLAKRKIWTSVTEMVINQVIDLSSVHFYAGTRDSTEVTYQLLSTYFSEQECAEQLNLSIKKCKSINDQILNSITSVRLKTSEDYKQLNTQIERRVHGKEKLRIFYLAVPPFAYSEIAKNIHMYCRLMFGDLRIAIEKPFGRDLTSAKNLANELRNNLADDEVYLVDHYLHKSGVKLMQQFLMYNSELLKPFWNRRNIKHVEIVARETVDVKGRSSYYNHYGVIRDMLQSHLTELMTIVATGVVDINDKEDKNEVKNLALQRITHPFLDSTFIGQYNGYKRHVIDDSSGSINSSRTPTFVSVVLYMQDINWFGVPFFISSGKSLLKAEGFVKIVFKDKDFGIFTNEADCIPEITFTFNSNSGEDHFITVSPAIHHDLKKHFLQEKLLSNEDSGSCSMYLLTPSQSSNTPLHPYTSVIMGLINGDRHLFVPLKNIIQSWSIWTPLLEEMEADHFSNIHAYNSDIVDHLKLTSKGTKLVTSFKEDAELLNSMDDSLLSISSTGVDHNMVTSTISGHPMYLASRTVILRQLGSDIFNAALKSVTLNNVFHMTLPGGSSPLQLFQILSIDYKESFPWRYTHIWQTDERCVDISSPDSNIYQLKQYLLDLVDIPPSNIHPILSNGKNKLSEL